MLSRSSRRVACALIASSLALVSAASAAPFEVDSTHSNVVFKVGHMGVANMFGMFHAPTGRYEFDWSNPTASKLEITVKTELVDTGNDRRDNHLRSPDFFNSKQFPEITFKGTSFEKAGDKSLKVVGDLTMLGVTKPVTVTVVHTGEGETKQGFKSGFEASFTIKRSEFGMTGYLEGNALSDEISLMVAIEGARK